MVYKMVCHTCGKTFEALGARLHCPECRDARYAGSRVEARLAASKESIGQRFGQLVVLEVERQRRSTQTVTMAHCRCDCGRETWATLPNIKSGKTRSCGCGVLQSHVATLEARREKRNQRTQAVINTLTNNPKLTYDQIGEIVGVTRQRVQQIAQRYFEPDDVEARKRKGRALRAEEYEELERLRLACKVTKKAPGDAANIDREQA